MLVVLSQQPANQDFMIEKSFEIFLQICIPALKLSSDERMLFEEEAVEFVNLFSDICSDKESDIIKNHAAHLLLALSKNVDGMQTFMIDFSLTMIENIINMNNEQSINYV